RSRRTSRTYLTSAQFCVRRTPRRVQRALHAKVVARRTSELGCTLGARSGERLGRESQRGPSWASSGAWDHPLDTRNEGRVAFSWPGGGAIGGASNSRVADVGAGAAMHLRGT